MGAVRGSGFSRTLVASIIAAIAAPAYAQSCGDGLAAPIRTASSERYVVAWRTTPANPPVGQHFVVDLAVCPKAGVPAPTVVRVDATMPDHRHGMNYKPTVTASAPGRFRAEGLMFHMPGRWQFVFEVGDGRRVDRVTADETLK
jgi:hypothetical protein